MTQLTPIPKTTIGSEYLGDEICRFTAWAPFSDSVEVELVQPHIQTHSLEKDKAGYWKAEIRNVVPGSQYFYRINGNLKRPDPASQFQPNGVHEASAVVDHQAYSWSDRDWQGLPMEAMIMYELHVGTFSENGTFEGVIAHLDELKDLGINTIELMPVAQFPGKRNWGYDGVYPFAVQNSYGGPKGLKKLVDACHQKGLAVLLDVVYNHLGPEGNYLADFGPYFTGKYTTPWGKALNFDDAYSDPVRNYFIQNALMWFRDYHIDGLRLDAVHAITDMSAYPFLKELADEVKAFNKANGRQHLLIAESDLNDTKLVLPHEEGGFGLHGQWCDDFHHALHAFVTGEQQGYYQDFGELTRLEQAFRQSFVYNHRYSEFRKKRFGSDATNVPADNFVVFSQNHDQVGNRAVGDRLSKLVSFEMLKLIAGTIFISPYIPMLFMGEEYGEENPFFYFVNHSDPDLIEAVRKGRKSEFEAFQWQGEIPDPQAEATFEQSKLSWRYKKEEGHPQKLREFYKTLIALRKENPVLTHLSKKDLKISADPDQLLLIIERKKEANAVLSMLNFSKKESAYVIKENHWQRLLDSTAALWGGPGPSSPDRVQPGETVNLQPESIVIYENT